MNDSQRLNAVLQGLAVPTFVIDAEHVVTHWNAACEHLTGFTAGQMVGSRRQWMPFYTSERPVLADLIVDGVNELSMAAHYLGKLCRSTCIEGAYETEIFYPSLGEGGVWLFFTAAPLMALDGKIIGAIQTFQDITGRKRAEEELQKHREQLEEMVLQGKAELTEVNEELSHYAFVVSHDLRAPLRAIRNYSDFLREEIEEQLTDEQRQYLVGIGKALRQGENLVNDLLEYSHVGHKSIHKQRIEMRQFLHELIESIGVPAEAEVSMVEDWPELAADRTLLEQMFCNLVGNAIKFNRSSRKLVELGWRRNEEGDCEIFVRDNGIGIDSRFHTQIFGMFKRLHGHKEYEGTGIGLAIVHKAVLKLNGSVRLESQLGHGSTFYVTLPFWEGGEKR